MKRATEIFLMAALFALSGQAADYPQATISNGKVKAVIYLPDSENGFYRGERFDWAGVVKSLEFAGHSFYGPWFTGTDATVRDFVFKDKDIVASPASADSGPVEEFRGTLGYDTAKAGDTFIKIGVGVFRKPDDTPYSNYKIYDMVDGGKWKVETTPTSVTFTQTLDVPAMGYGYVYTKRLRLADNAPELTIEHTLKNTGKLPIASSVYDHNFLVLDGTPIGPGISVHVPYKIDNSRPPANGAAEVAGSEFHYLKKVENEDHVSGGLQGFGKTPSDYDFRIENTMAGAGVHITGDRPLTGASLWSIRSVVAVEPTIAVTADPGADFSWKYTYDYFTLTK